MDKQRDKRTKKTWAEIKHKKTVSVPHRKTETRLGKKITKQTDGQKDRRTRRQSHAKRQNKTDE